MVLPDDRSQHLKGDPDLIKAWEVGDRHSFRQDRVYDQLFFVLCADEIGCAEILGEINNGSPVEMFETGQAFQVVDEAIEGRCDLDAGNAVDADVQPTATIAQVY